MRFPLSIEEQFAAEIRRLFSTPGFAFDAPQEPIEVTIARMAQKINTWAFKKLSAFMRRKFRRQEVNVQITDEFLQEKIKRWVAENVAFISDIAQQNKAAIDAIVMEGSTGGASVDTIAGRLEEQMRITASRAELIARDQTGTLMGQIDEYRMKGAGFPGYIWRTSLDRRVRDSHRDLEGKFFRWDETPPGLNKPGARIPGDDYQCRCTAEPSDGPEGAAA